MPQTMGQAPFYFYSAESKQQQQQQQMLRQVHGLPATPAYSRPGSSSLSQPPTLYSNGPTVMASGVSSAPSSRKPSIMLETDLAGDSYFPATPPLSTAGSSIGSPNSYDILQTPMNPMFSGLEGFETAKDTFEPPELVALDWSSCGSPPMTPGKWRYFLLLVKSTLDVFSLIVSNTGAFFVVCERTVSWSGWRWRRLRVVLKGGFFHALGIFLLRGGQVPLKLALYFSC